MASEREPTPLEAAMSSSFEYNPDTVERKVDASPTSPTAPTAPPAPAAQLDTESAPETSGGPDWKPEYDARLAEWRTAAAIARDKAESTRAHWEAIRADESARGVLRPPIPLPANTTTTTAAVPVPLAPQAHASVASSVSGWESLDVSVVDPVGAKERDSPSPADVRDMVSGERPGGRGAQVLDEVLGPRTTEKAPDMDEGSGKEGNWEHLSSASSFPSPPSAPEAHIERVPSKAGSSPTASPARSITLLLFDPSTNGRTKALALVAALGINFVLPFFNGMMIGFGEIAAKGIINWWKGGVALGTAAAGMRTARPIL